MSQDTELNWVYVGHYTALYLPYTQFEKWQQRKAGHSFRAQETQNDLNILKTDTKFITTVNELII